MKKKLKRNKKSFNMYEYMYKNKKKVVTFVSAILILSMVLGTFAQFIYNF